jgi:hypothetical protein
MNLSNRSFSDWTLVGRYIHKMPIKAICRIYSCAAASIFAAALAGCGSNTSPVAQVRGKVLLNGEPLAKGAIVTLPEGGRGARGAIIDGQFELGTFGNADGALIGTHKVAIIANEPAQTTDPEAPPSKSLIPQRYNNPAASGLTIEVKASEANTPTIKLTSP